MFGVRSIATSSDGLILTKAKARQPMFWLDLCNRNKPRRNKCRGNSKCRPSLHQQNIHFRFEYFQTQKQQSMIWHHENWEDARRNIIGNGLRICPWLLWGNDNSENRNYLTTPYSPMEIVGAHICPQSGYVSSMLLERNQADRKRQTQSGTESSCHHSVRPTVASCVNNKPVSNGRSLLASSVPCWVIKHTTASCSEGLNCVIGGSWSETLPSKSPVHFPKQLLGLTMTEASSKKTWSHWP